MSSCPNELQVEHIGKIASLESKVSALEDKMDILDSINNSVTKLTTLIEVQFEENKKRDAILAQLSDTTTKTSQTLERLNDRISHTDSKIDKVESKISKLESKVDDSESKSKIDIRDVLKSLCVKWLIPVGGISAIGYEIFKLIKG